MLHDLLKSRPQQGPLTEFRQDCAKRFMDAGWPKPTDEAWRFTNVNKLAQRELTPQVDAGDANTHDLPDGARIVVVNGVIDQSLTTLMPDGVELVSLADDAELAATLHDDRLINHGIASLTLAVLASGFGLRVKGQAAAPVHLIYRNDGADASTHGVGVIVLEDGAKATILEHHSGNGDGLSAPVLAIKVGKAAELSHARVQAEADDRHHLAMTVMSFDENARYNGLSVQTGCAISRAENNIALVGEHVDMTLTTIYLAKDSQVMDVTALVDHQMPNCTSRQIVRGVLDDQARGVFQGKVIVARDAQKTDGNQMSRALLLSRKCEADAKPELEIYADDVVCSHGATVGELDDNHLFYLMSRGISKPEARQILIEAFLSDVLDDVEDDDLRNFGLPQVSAWLSTMRNGV